MKFSAMIVGCGKFAGLSSSKNIITHAEAFAKSKEIDLVACVDTNKYNLLKFKKKYNCKDYSSIDHALSSNKIDIASVCTNNEMHYSVVRELIISKYYPKVIFLEKPAFLKISEFNKIRELNRTKKIKIVVNHTRRFNSNFRILKKIISKNKFGNPIRISTNYYGGWVNNGCHLVDSILFLFNKEIEIIKIYGFEKSRFLNDPSFNVLGKFKDKNTKIYFNAINEKYYQIFEFDIWFEKARIRVENFETKFFLDIKKIDENRENILVRKKINRNFSTKNELDNALSELCIYLRNKKSKILDDKGLSNALTTMKVIWSIKNFKIRKR